MIKTPRQRFTSPITRRAQPKKKVDNDPCDDIKRCRRGVAGCISPHWTDREIKAWLKKMDQPVRQGSVSPFCLIDESRRHIKCSVGTLGCLERHSAKQKRAAKPWERKR